jgi:hypothetical protein
MISLRCTPEFIIVDVISKDIEKDKKEFSNKLSEFHRKGWKLDSAI